MARSGRCCCRRFAPGKEDGRCWSSEEDAGGGSRAPGPGVNRIFDAAPRFKGRGPAAVGRFAVFESGFDACSRRGGRAARSSRSAAEELGPAGGRLAWSRMIPSYKVWECPRGTRGV